MAYADGYRVFYSWVYRAAESTCRFSPHRLALLAVIPLLLCIFDTHAVDLSLKARLDFDHAAHSEDTSTLKDGWLRRRARLGVEGSHNHWQFEVQYDFNNDGEFKDAYVSYSGWNSGALTVGQFKTPSGLEQQTGSSSSTFIERSLPTDALATSRRVGIGFAQERANHTVSAMVYGRSIDDADERPGMGIRTTFAPLLEKDWRVVHVGGWVSYEDVKESVKISARPEARPADEKLLRTGTIKQVNAITRAGIEAAWQHGPLSVQSEWMHLYLHRNSRKTDIALDGLYVGASWVVTGESRRYRYGRFKGIPAERPSGAWELAARLSYLDLNDGQVSGGREHNLTLGVNWYVKDNLRLMLNYIDVNSRRRGKSDNPEIVLLRIQVAI